MTDSSPAVSAKERLAHALDACDFPTYVYSYPSKRAYRHVRDGQTIASVWASAPAQLNLYLHVPFCAYRCAFCTLFLTTSHTPGLVDDYVDALARQIAMYGRLLGDREVVSIYVGGGTPTTLSPRQFARVFAAIDDAFPLRSAEAEVGVEGSPDSVNPEIVECLGDHGVNRFSMGLQTLDPDELRTVGRRYDLATVERAVSAIDAGGFENVNYDLIYGLEGQDHATWERSLRRAVDLGPHTLTLYPVVFRPLTVIERHRQRDATRFVQNESKYALYDASVAITRNEGFRQDSFVRFTRLVDDGYRQEASDFSGVPLLGLGAGARSYTADVHYGTDFAVGRRETNDIISGFIGHDHRPDEPIGLGFVLDADEQKRRFCILTLSLGRLDPNAYAGRFAGASLMEDFGEELHALESHGLTRVDEQGVLHLTRSGFKFSNVIGSLFQSTSVGRLEEMFVAT